VRKTKVVCPDYGEKCNCELTLDAGNRTKHHHLRNIRPIMPDWSSVENIRSLLILKLNLSWTIIFILNVDLQHNFNEMTVFCTGASCRVTAEVRWCVHTGHGSQGLPVERQRCKCLWETQSMHAVLRRDMFTVHKEIGVERGKFLCCKNENCYGGNDDVGVGCTWGVISPCDDVTVNVIVVNGVSCLPTQNRFELSTSQRVWFAYYVESELLWQAVCLFVDGSSHIPS